MNNGLTLKYNVTKIEDGSIVGNCFVLRPDMDHAARAALKAYADATPNNALRRDIRGWIDEIESEIMYCGKQDGGAE